MKKIFILIIVTTLLVVPFSIALAVTTGTTDGTYDFGNLGPVNSGGEGFKIQGDKFCVSSGFVQDGGATSIYPNDFGDVGIPGASFTGVIKAEGGSTNKSFTFNNMRLSTFTGDNVLQTFTITFKDMSENIIATHSLYTNQEVPSGGIDISSFAFGLPFPAGGYDNVAEIHITANYVSNDYCMLTFETITISNVTASVNTAPVASSVSISGTATYEQEQTGSYTYSDAENDAQGTSTFQWYRADNASGSNKTPISGATASTYTLTTADVDKHICFESRLSHRRGQAPARRYQAPTRHRCSGQTAPRPPASHLLCRAKQTPA